MERIIVTIENGLITCQSSTAPIELVVVDYDTPDGQPTETVYEPEKIL